MGAESVTTNFRRLLDALDAEHHRQLALLRQSCSNSHQVLPSSAASDVCESSKRDSVDTVPPSWAAWPPMPPTVDSSLEDVSSTAPSRGSTSKHVGSLHTPGPVPRVASDVCQHLDLNEESANMQALGEELDHIEITRLGSKGTRLPAETVDTLPCGTTALSTGARPSQETNVSHDVCHSTSVNTGARLCQETVGSYLGGRRTSEPVRHSPQDGKTFSSVELVSAFAAAKQPSGHRVSVETAFFSNKLQEVLDSEYFEAFIMTLILANTATMALDMQFEGLNIGHDSGLGDVGISGNEAFPGATEVFPALEVCFTVIFATELMARLVVGGAKGAIEFFKAPLNWLDVGVVVTGVAGIAVAGTEVSNTPQVFRLLRLSKLARSMRLLHSTRILASIHLFASALRAGLSLMGWSILLLIVIQCIAAMLIGQLVQPYLMDTGADAAGRREVYEFYGTFTRALLTMFETTLGNWGPPCRVLVNNVGEIYALFFMIYRCFVGFAILNVITAVFVQGTTKAAQADLEVSIALKQKDKQNYLCKLTNLFRAMDESGDGFLSWQEFSQTLADPNLRAWLSTLDLEPADVSELWDLVDDGDGKISIDEFLYALPRLKGIAKSVDLLSLWKHIKRIENIVSCGFAWDTKETSTCFPCVQLA